MNVRRYLGWSKWAALTGTVLISVGCVPPQSPPQTPRETGSSSSAPTEGSSNTTQSDGENAPETPGAGGGY